MTLHTPESGGASPLFGEKFPYILDGKLLMYEICREFSAEFEDAARKALNADSELIKLPVASAYPTSKSQCPRIAVIRTNTRPALAGLGAEIDVFKTDEGSWRYVRGAVCTDSVEVSICTLNERMRDDLHLWLQQYMLDAIRWLLPRLNNVNSFVCTSAMDDMVEYQGSAPQAGFQFYVARQNYEIKYDQIVAETPDIIASIVNWQSIGVINNDEE